MEIRKGMYGIPHTGKIANDRLVKHLAEHSYVQVTHTHGLFTHKTRKGLIVSLVVDDFSVRYINRADANHLVSTLTSLYTSITNNWTGSTYLGLTLDWDYKARTCGVSMPGYISHALQRFAIPAPTKAQHSPHAWKKPNYGTKTQLTEPADLSAPLPPKDRKHLQEVIGVLLYYGRAVDSTILVTLGTLAAAQAQGTQATAEACIVTCS